jgi:hypothetical protein
MTKMIAKRLEITHTPPHSAKAVKLTYMVAALRMIARRLRIKTWTNRKLKRQTKQ